MNATNLKRSVERWALAGAAKGIHCDLNIDPDCMIPHLDADAWERILSNAMQNAWRAMPAGGKLAIEARPVLMAFGRNGEANGGASGRTLWMRIRFADTGHGISREVLERLFEPGFTTRPQQGGNGLGLSGMLRLMTRLGGFITVDSSPGKGATFDFYFPAGEPGLAG